MGEACCTAHLSASQGFGNFQEVPFAVEMKYVVYKQIAASMYPGFAFALSGAGC